VRHEPFRSSTALTFSTAMQRQSVGERNRLQTTFALATVLTAQNPKLCLLAPSPSGVDKTIEAAACTRRLSGIYVYRSPDQTIDVFHRLNGAK
jgi:hypothetical protein